MDKYLKTSQRMLDLYNEVKTDRISRIIYTDETMRGIGKTYSLYNILKNDESTVLLIQTPKFYQNEYMIDIDKSRIFGHVNSMRGIDKNNIVLVDEWVSKEEFDELNKLGIIYCGYRHINTL